MTVKAPRQHHALSAFAFPLGLVGLMALIYFLSWIGIGGSAQAWGNIPRHTDHLYGILTFHLQHGSWGHWLANAIPLVVLSGMAGTLMPKATARTWLFLPLVSGILLWLWGRPAAHVGASALVYGWFFFLLGMGVMKRSLAALTGMVIALFLFSGLLWVLSAPAGVSWEGHLAGAIAGLLSARIWRHTDDVKEPKLHKY